MEPGVSVRVRLWMEVLVKVGSNSVLPFGALASEEGEQETRQSLHMGIFNPRRRTAEPGLPQSGLPVGISA